MNWLVTPIFRNAILLASLFVFTLCPTLASAQDDGFDKSVHIIVVLADNANQGIVKVPAKLGDGTAPRTNLYWGALYGVKSYFKRQDDITILKPISKLPDGVLDQADFSLQTNGQTIFIHAEAWRGDKMRPAIRRFYALLTDEASADLIVFVGHNGLMDGPVAAPFSIADQPKPGAGKDAIVLACLSDKYFSDTLSNIGTTPLVMTRGLMAPEAYSLLPAIKSWAANESPNNTRNAAAKGYAHYQKIPLRNAQRLFGATP